MAKSPSLLALLGLVAVAGYQNRDKISDILKAARSDGTGQPGGVLADLARSIGAEGSRTEGLAGGLHDLVERFRSAGKGAMADSWVSPDANRDVQADELAQIIGDDMLRELEAKTGLAQADLLARLSAGLPETVNRMTPKGRLPTDAELRGL